MTKATYILPAVLGAAILAQPAQARDFELSFYLGHQSAPHANVEGSDPGNAVSADVDFTPAFEGRPFDAPPYYGFRATWWENERFGFGLDLNHAKVYANEDDAAAAGFQDFELTDGLNIFTANGYYRWPTAFGAWTPYVGAGLGVAVPHVDVSSAGGTTFGYQLTGPAVTWIAGASRPINETWDMFVDYKGTYSLNTMELDNGGELEAKFVTNALNVGITYKF